MKMKKVALGLFVASTLIGDALANSGVLFSKPDDPSFETPLEAMARQDRRRQEDRRNASSLPAERPRAAAIDPLSDGLFDRLTRESSGGAR